ncbi:hypothetical protein ZIOFF_038036 [Zingiber officinale]|uniref:Peptidyl-prolyl cis-trans isomerase n=1 Tax=Zingiber officinale TaxID=94328 RepID=A0A8J5GE14_ZINOF|nr:hypothetical protein ZIOFF_038036 [Zingiber officinale]
MIRNTVIAFVFLAFILLGVSIINKEARFKVEKEPEITHRVFLDVDIDGQHLGRIVIGLYGEVVPKTAVFLHPKFNMPTYGLFFPFSWLVQTISELYAQAKRKMELVEEIFITREPNSIALYQGLLFKAVTSLIVMVRAVNLYMVVLSLMRTFQSSIHEQVCTVLISCRQTGIVSMVNSGPDSNGSQFFITTVKASWLDGEHVAFGRAIQGIDTVFAIEGGAGTYNGKPRKKVTIVDSGEIPKDQWVDE